MDYVSPWLPLADAFAQAGEPQAAALRRALYDGVVRARGTVDGVLLDLGGAWFADQAELSLGRPQHNQILKPGTQTAHLWGSEIVQIDRPTASGGLAPAAEARPVMRYGELAKDVEVERAGLEKFLRATAAAGSNSRGRGGRAKGSGFPKDKPRLLKMKALVEAGSHNRTDAARAVLQAEKSAAGGIDVNDERRLVRSYGREYGVTKTLRG
jgi:hypothetical protein